MSDILLPPKAPNLLAGIPTDLPQELSETLLGAAAVRIERIVSRGHASPPGFWYDQAEHEWVLLVQGQARLRIGEDIVELSPGDYLNIPAHLKHRVEWTSPDQDSIWLAVFYRDA